MSGEKSEHEIPEIILRFIKDFIKDDLLDMYFDLKPSEEDAFLRNAYYKWSKYNSMVSKCYLDKLNLIKDPVERANLRDGVWEYEESENLNKEVPNE